MRHRKAFRPPPYDFPLMYKTTQKSKDMITENESRLTMGVQLHILVAKHGLENVAEMIMRLCEEQSRLNDDPAIEDSIKNLERLIKSSSQIQNWK